MGSRLPTNASATRHASKQNPNKKILIGCCAAISSKARIKSKKNEWCRIGTIAKIMTRTSLHHHSMIHIVSNMILNSQWLFVHSKLVLWITKNGQLAFGDGMRTQHNCENVRIRGKMIDPAARHYGRQSKQHQSIVWRKRVIADTGTRSGHGSVAVGAKVSARTTTFAAQVKVVRFHSRKY